MIDIVIGGQFGSEGKGSVVSWLARKAKKDGRPYDMAIRIGGVNAGHTFKPYGGEPIAVRQIPACFDSVECLYLASGSIIDENVLWEELHTMVTLGANSAVYISPYATVQSEHDKKFEAGLVDKIGSTGKGVGAARANRIMRDAAIVRDTPRMRSFVDENEVQNVLHRHNAKILIETTQGYGLSLMSNFYPYCTSANLNPYQALSDADIPFRVHHSCVHLVVRVHPIRVAGNSGELLDETTWDKLRKELGNHIPTEKTTVTKKVRRVGMYNAKQVVDAQSICCPSYTYLTFADYMMPELKNREGNISISDIYKGSHALGQIVALSKATHIGTGIGTIMKLMDNDPNMKNQPCVGAVREPRGQV